MLKPIVGAIEAGGTKCIGVIGSGPEDIRAEIRIPTTDPDETIGELLRFFAEYEQSNGRVSAVGIACFGPLDLAPDSPTYGSMSIFVRLHLGTRLACMEPWRSLFRKLIAYPV